MVETNEKTKEYDILGIVAHYQLYLQSKTNNEKPYQLPPMEQWTEEFCNTLNRIEFSENLKYELDTVDTDNNLNNLECIYEEDKNNITALTEDEKEIRDTFLAYQNIPDAKVSCIYRTDYLPNNVKYVRFTDTVILRKDENIKEYAKQCSESISEGLGILNTFNIELDNLLGNAGTNFSSDVKKHRDDLEKLKRICMLHSHFNMNNDRHDPPDNYIWNELLQNANDHIVNSNEESDELDRLDKGKLYIKIGENEEGKVSIELSYDERTGFRVKDFVAVASSGNSGHKNENNSSHKEATGHKGTGFKSVYNVFEKVVIKSNNVECVLDDREGSDGDIGSYKLNFENASFYKKKNDKEKNDKEKNKDGQKNFPIPIFEYDKTNKGDKTTSITLYFKDNDEKKNDFIKEICDITRYYFLNNIDTVVFSGDIEVIKKGFNFKGDKNETQGENNTQDKNETVWFEENGNTFIFKKEEYMRNNFYRYSTTFSMSEEDWGTSIDENPWYNKYKDFDEFAESGKNKFEILFPKDVSEFQRMPLYSTLPIGKPKEDDNSPFNKYIQNWPALWLNNDRNNLSGNNKKWNGKVVKKVAYEYNSCFHRIFEKFVKGKDYEAKKDLEVKAVYEDESHLDIAYQYFPYHHLKSKGWECLTEIHFIRTVTDKNSKPQAKSISEWYKELPDGHTNWQDTEIKKRFVFLPPYMYKWFELAKGLDGYSCDVPFVYYEDKEANFYPNYQKGDYDFRYENETVEQDFAKHISKNINHDNIIEVLKCIFGTGEKKAGKILDSIECFFNNKFYSDKTDEKYTKNTENGSNSYKDLLKELYNDKVFDDKNKYQLCYRWYLGKEICEKEYYHDLDGIDTVTIEKQEWKNIGEIRLELSIFFSENLKKVEDQKEDTEEVKKSKQFNQCFTNLRTKLYYKKEDDIETLCPVDDLFLQNVINPLKEQKDKEEQKDKFFQIINKIINICSKELVDEKDIDGISKFFNKGFIPLQCGKDTEPVYEFSDSLEDKNKKLFISENVEAKYIVKKPEWIVKPECNFFENLDRLIILENIDKLETKDLGEKYKLYISSTTEELNKYLKLYKDSDKVDKESLFKTVNYFIQFCFENTSSLNDNDKLLSLLQWLLENDKNPIIFKWNPSGNPDVWNRVFWKKIKEVKTDLQFEYNVNNENILPQHLEEKLECLSEEDKQKLRRDLFRNEGDVNNDDIKTGFVFLNKNDFKGYFYLKQEDSSENSENNKPKVVLLNEDGFYSYLRSLDIAALNAKPYDSMSSYEASSIISGLRYNDNDDNFSEIIQKIDKNNVIENMKNDDKKILKFKLLARFDTKVDKKWYHFEGYGGENYGCRCPVCKSHLYIEATVLDTRQIKLHNGVYVPVLLCRNCKEVFSYAEDINLVFKNNEIEKDCDINVVKEAIDEKTKEKSALRLLYDKLIDKNAKCYVQFNLYNTEKEEEIKLTTLHRIWAMYEIEKRLEFLDNLDKSSQITEEK